MIKKLDPKDNSSMKITKIMLINGLIDLIQKKHIKEVTVKELCEFSQVGRKTFYRHYQSKEEIIWEYIVILMDQLFSKLEYRSFSTKAEAMEEFFKFWSEHKDFVKLLATNQICYFLILVSERLTEEEEYRTRLKKIFHDQSPSDLTLIYTIAGSFRMLQKWIYNEMEFTPGEMAQLVSPGN